MCVNLNQILHSNVCHPKTNVYSLMWYSPIFPSCHCPDFASIIDSHAKSVKTKTFSLDLRNKVWTIYLNEQWPSAVAHLLKPNYWSPIESTTKWWIVKLDSVQMVIRNFKLDRKNSNKKPRICNHFRNEPSRGVFWTVLFSTVWLIINKQSSTFVLLNLRLLYLTQFFL